MDSGGHSIKMGTLSDINTPSYILPNCIAQPTGHVVQTILPDAILPSTQGILQRPMER